MHRPPSPNPNDSFVTTTLDGGGLSTRKLLILTMLGMLLLATVGGTVFVVGGGLDPTTTTTAAFVPGKPAPTPIPTATLPSAPSLGPATPPPGFGANGPPNAESIAFVAGVTYECGNVNQQVIFAASVDVGLHWKMYPVVLQDGACTRVLVNPLNVQQIVVIVNPCLLGCKSVSPPSSTIYLSLTGGLDWQSLTLPDDSVVSVETMTWADGALWIGCMGTHLLAKAVPNAAVRWVDFGKANVSSMYLAGIYYSHSAIFAVFGELNAVTILTLRSDDQGVTWHTVNLRDASDSVQIAGEAPDGSAIIGVGTQGRLETSTDDGKTWNIAPSYDGVAVSTFVLTPDGTLIGLTVIGNSGFQFIALAVHASNWKTIIQMSAMSQQFAGVSWDVAGHPTAVWLFASSGSLPRLAFFIMRCKMWRRNKSLARASARRVGDDAACL